MDKTQGKQEIRAVVYLLALLWILPIFAVVVIQSVAPDFNFAASLLKANLPSLVLIPILMYGLWFFKNWGLIFGYLMVAYRLIILPVFFSAPIDLLEIIIWGGIGYYLHKNKDIFHNLHMK